MAIYDAGTDLATFSSIVNPRPGWQLLFEIRNCHNADAPAPAFRNRDLEQSLGMTFRFTWSSDQRRQRGAVPQ